MPVIRTRSPITEMSYSTHQNIIGNGAKVDVDFISTDFPGIESTSQYLPYYPQLRFNGLYIWFFNIDPGCTLFFASGFSCSIPVYNTGDPSERVVPVRSLWANGQSSTRAKHDVPCMERSW